MHHTPVLLKEVLHYLAPKPNQNFIDCTLGLGGHSKAILEKTAPVGKLLAIEQNAEGLHEAQKNLVKYKNRITYINGNFANLNEIVRDSNLKGFFGIFLDLGLASWQIDEGDLGISFQKDEPLDMRLEKTKNPSASLRAGQKLKTKNLTAADVINKYPLKKLADVLYQYGDIRNSYAIAKKIVNNREKSPIKTTFQLQEILQTKNPKFLAPVFQALRIEVNNELNNLIKVLSQIAQLLKTGGRVVIISYHSGEDRIVKNYFRDNKETFKILTKKPIIPSDEEIKQNSRSRSAKLRAFEKI
ncbi:MAG: Ribosomal RNA small subunit methyltransferase H [uncultured bacterium]|nr:MAG: Ribosomal RNA small subunit methyltransferase H [uncultured bacterium]